MADTKWVKIQIDMFDNPKLKIIDSMENNNLIHYIWTSSILLAGRSNNNGELYLTEGKPYTIKTLAIAFRRTVEEVKEAFKVLRKLKMIELTEDRVFKIRSWEKYQNVDGLDKIRKQTNERVAKYREKKREEKKAAEEKKKATNSGESKHKDEYSDDENIQDKHNKKDKTIDSQEQDNKTNSNNDNNSNKKLDIISQSDVISDGEDKSITEEVSNEDIIFDNVTDSKCVTCNNEAKVTDDKNIVTETQQNKKKTKKKSRKREKDDTVTKDCGIENNSLSENENIYSKAIELSEYCERITGRVGVLDINSLNMAVDMHGSDNVKKAIREAINQEKLTMRYVNGILKNWEAEGYPPDREQSNNTKSYGGIKENGSREKCYDKGSRANSNESERIKPKEPRKLTEEERREVCKNVI